MENFKNRPKVTVINGVNLNMLGIREPEIYGHQTYAQLVEYIKQEADALGIEVSVFQSNYEGEIVEAIQECRLKGSAQAIIINAGAYSHTSIAILDALKAANLPTVEVHLSDVSKREPFRLFSYISLYASGYIRGKGFLGYKLALEECLKLIGPHDR